MGKAVQGHHCHRRSQNDMDTVPRCFGTALGWRKKVTCRSSDHDAVEWNYQYNLGCYYRHNFVLFGTDPKPRNRCP